MVIFGNGWLCGVDVLLLFYVALYRDPANLNLLKNLYFSHMVFLLIYFEGELRCFNDTSNIEGLPVTFIRKLLSCGEDRKLGMLRAGGFET